MTFDRSGQSCRLPFEVWHEALRPLPEARARSRLELGDRLQAIAGQGFVSKPGVVFYREGDVGTVTGVDAEKVCITWDESQRTTNKARGSWLQGFRLLPERRNALPDIGESVQALAGQSFTGTSGLEYYAEDDVGIVSGLDDEKIFVTWERTERTSTKPCATWMQAFTALPGQRVKSLLAVGDRVEALLGQSAVGSREVRVLPGQLLGRSAGADPKQDVALGQQYAAGAPFHYFCEGDLGTVSSIDLDDAHITWDRTGCTSSRSLETWLQAFRIVPDSFADPAEALPCAGDRVEALSVLTGAAGQDISGRTTLVQYQALIRELEGCM